MKIKSIKGKVLFNLLCNVESFIGEESKIILSTIPFTSSNFKVSLIRTPPKPNPIKTISFCLLIPFSFKVNKYSFKISIALSIGGKVKGKFKLSTV